MARRRRRARVPLGFGAGGRSALISSLLPTASERAEAERAKRAIDSQKISAFNREEITLAELEAYFNERLAGESDATTKTEIQSLIDNARAADKKRRDAQVGTDAKQAIGDFQSGNASFEATKEALTALRSQAQDPELRESIDRLIRDAGQMSTQRDINTHIEEYNKGRLPYTELAAYLEKQVAATENTVLREQIAKAQDMARENETNKVLSETQAAYKAGRMTIAEATARLDALRKDSSMMNPETLEKINATIAVFEANEQAILDHKTYIAWQTGTMSDTDALMYFQGRLAADNTAEGAETLGKYTVNIKGAIDQKNSALAKEAASGQYAGAVRQARAAADRAATTYGTRVATGVGPAATASVAEIRAGIKIAFADYDKNMQIHLEASQGDPTRIFQLYNHRATKLREYATLLGLRAPEYAELLQDNTFEAVAVVAKYQWADFEKDVARLKQQYLTPGTVTQTDAQKEEGDTLLSGKVPWESYISGHLAVAARAREAMASPWLTQEQKDDIATTRTASLYFTKAVIEQREEMFREAEGTLSGAISNAWNDLPQIQRDKYLNDFAAFDQAARKDIRGVLGAAFLAANPNKTSQDADAYVASIAATAHAIDENRTTILGVRPGGESSTGPSTLGKAKIDWLKESYPNSWPDLGVYVNPDGTTKEGVLRVSGAAGDDPEFMRESLIGRRGTSDPTGLPAEIETAFDQPFLVAENPEDPGDKLIVNDPLSHRPLPAPPTFESVSVADIPTHTPDGRQLSTIERNAITVWTTLGHGMEAAVRHAVSHGDYINTVAQVYADTVNDAVDTHVTQNLKALGGAIGQELELFLGDDLENFAKIWDRDVAEPVRDLQDSVNQAGATIRGAWEGVTKGIGDVFQQWSVLSQGVAAADLVYPDVSEDARDVRDRDRITQELIDRSANLSWDSAEDQNSVAIQYPTYNPDWNAAPIEMPAMVYPEYNPDWSYQEPDPYVFNPVITPGYQAPNVEENPAWTPQPWTPPVYEYNPPPPQYQPTAPVSHGDNIAAYEPWTPPTFELPPDFYTGGGGSAGAGGGTGIDIQQ